MTSKPHGPSPSSGPGHKCRGTLVLIQDQYGPYLDCMNCGTVLYQDAPAEMPDNPPATRRHRPGSTWRPRSREGRKRYQDWLRVIVDDGLSSAQAAERFGVSVRTIYRVLNGYRPGSR